MIFAYVSIFSPGIPCYQYHICGLIELVGHSELVVMSKFINLSLIIVFVTLVSPYSVISHGSYRFIYKQILLLNEKNFVYIM